MLQPLESRTVQAEHPLATYACGAGEPILLVMGLACCAADWGPLRSQLARVGRVISFDNRGTGSSGAPPQDMTLDMLSRDTLAVLDAYEVESVNLVGYSMGGMISQLLALEHPERVKRLALLSTHAGARSCVPLTHEAMQVLFKPKGQDVAEIMRRQLEVFSAPGFPDRRSDTFEAMLSTRLDNLTAMQTVALQMQAIQASERAERLGGLKMPTLIVHGREDQLIPAGNAEHLKQLLPHAELHVLDGVGHMLPWEAPETVAAKLEAFLKR